ncbi:MAG: glutamate-1-semialdehyde 2,1-aminomutase [Bdellovibrionales bacterium]|nr:glutamate-1-semialdehyde 2,1-aminomutase [Bdellovibrionales bacterium]
MQSRSTQKSEVYFGRAKRVAPGGVHSPVRGFRGVGGTPRFIESAQGVCLKDADGNEYIDYCLSWGPLLFGHQDPEIAEAVKSALARGWSYGTAERYSLEFAEELIASLPFVDQIRFVNSGTEAVMSALRVARGFTKRDLILKFDGCYHGHADGLLVRAGSGLAEMASPDSAGISAKTASETIVCPLDDEAALKSAFEAHGKDLAAVIIEPLPANNGLLIQRTEFLRLIESLCKKHGTLLILDEVISGFRVALGGMAELTGIKPDLVTYGKIIGGGFPVGAYGGRHELMQMVAPAGPVYQAGTLSANPVAMAAGHAMLKKINRENPYARLAETGAKMVADIQKIADAKLPFPMQVQGFGSISWIVCNAPKGTPVRRIEQIPAEQKPYYAKIFHGLLDRGVYLAPSGYEVAFLSTAHTERNIDFTLNAIEKVFGDTQFK